jgi:6-pyruvoyl-tetrahydropterin synthase
MIKINQTYHFHGAHRNRDLKNHCRFIHGHTFHIRVLFIFPDSDGELTILFSELKEKVNKVLDAYDHAFCIHEKDELISFIQSVIPDQKFVFCSSEPGAEFLAKKIFHEIKNTGLPIVELGLKETTTSEVIYKDE